jgi:mannitol/fructose-specific phosphotransferase system IIA component (Ntr-type)
LAVTLQIVSTRPTSAQPGIDFGATDGEAVRVFLVLLSPASVAGSAHHELMARDRSL